MSAAARKRANEQRAAYPAALVAFLTDDDAPVYDDGSTFVAVPCPDCGRLLLACEHDTLRRLRGETRSDIRATAQ